MPAFSAARLLTPNEVVERPVVLVEDGHVREIIVGSALAIPAAASLLDFGESVIAPGYVDLHIHGNAGFDVTDDSAKALPAIGQALARHGVTSYFPTTVTAPVDATLQALERLADAIERNESNVRSQSNDHPAVKAQFGAVPIGIHLEGPFISHARRGVHPPENLLIPTLALFEKFWQAARGHIRMMTIAPELENAPEVIAEAARRGVCVSLGHSDADFAAAQRGIAAGAHHATHIFNAMRPLDHRSPGILGAVLTDDRVSADLIADGVHLDPATVKIVARQKGPQQTVLITDATSATGMPNGRYHLGALEVEVRDGVCTHDGKLAGSVLTMDLAVRNLARFAGWPLQQAVASASRNPARVAQIVNKGVLEVGAAADFVVLNAQGEVLRTFIGGVECVR